MLRDDRKPGSRPAPALPVHRRLRIYAIDPGASRDMATALVNEATVRVAWEAGLGDGPVGEYVDVIDVDPLSGCFYAPVRLDDPYLLAQDGHAPSEANPQFHQQMVYAVAMLTIRNFERALGRKALWSSRRCARPSPASGGASGLADASAPWRPAAADRDDTGPVWRGRNQDEHFVRRLRIYPHALREENAYYSSHRKAVLFGYFTAREGPGGRHLPGGMIFTCLSHDVIAHEVTHALLDGMHVRYTEPSNVDSLAFHEAFADIVALFQHFTFPETVRYALARTRGSPDLDSPLGKVAHEFGEATGHQGALRDYIRTRADPDALKQTAEPHARGAILVAAVFDAYRAIYRAQVADLLRIATGCGDRFPELDLHPDLLTRVAAEATRVAGQILNMCIRALDYCPPVDITFSDYLRAVLTADHDSHAEDARNYRLALVEAFRRRGIFPSGVRSLAVDSLIWKPVAEELDFSTVAGDLDLRLTPERLESWRRARENCVALHRWLSRRLEEQPGLDHELGIAFGSAAPQTIRGGSGGPRFEIHSVRVARRMTAEREPRHDLVIEIAQRRRGFMSEADQELADRTPWRRLPEHLREGDFTFRGGCTLIVDTSTWRVRHGVRKGILSASRLATQRRFFAGDSSTSLARTYFGSSRGGDAAARWDEPLAMLHRGL